MIDRVRLWIRSVVLRRRLEREMQEEMAEHIERATARLMARGLPAAEARRQAIREFGNVPYLQDQARDARGTAWLDALVADVRFALRHFARKPVTTLVMFVVLAAGMAISTLLFSYVHSYAVEPPPGIVREEGLVRIRGSQTAGSHGRASRTFPEEEFRAYRQLTGQFDAVAGWMVAPVVLDAGAGDELRGLEARASFVTENYFSVLGVQPLLGAGLPAHATDDPALGAVAVISHVTWDQLYGRNPAVIGSTIMLNGVPVTIAGVAAERFVGVAGFGRFQLWLPLSLRAAVLREETSSFRAVGRLRPGTSTRAATAAVQAIAVRSAATDAELRAIEPSTDVVPLLSANGDPMFDRDVRLMSLSVGLLGLLVLLVTCTNVSALLTGLAAARRQEIAVRLSLGAARSRLIRQLLTESALLAICAGAAALTLAWLVLHIVTSRIPDLPFRIAITWQATTFTLGIALSVGILFGLSPALHATRLAIAGVLRDSVGMLAGTRARLQRGLVVAQIAFTQPLIVLLAAVLLVALGVRPRTWTPSGDRVITMYIFSRVAHSTDYGSGEDVGRQLSAVTRDLLDRVRATAGVEAAAINWAGPSDPRAYVVDPRAYVVDEPDRSGAAAPEVALSLHPVAETYLEVMDIPLVRGRKFTTGDRRSAQSARVEVPAIVGADLARRLWAGRDPVGRRLHAATDSVPETLVVVGVVDDPMAETRNPGDPYRVFLPPDTSRPHAALLVRTAGAARPLIPTLRRYVLEGSPGLATRIRTIAEVEDENRRRFRIVTGSISAAGLMALLLSAIGLYAVVAFSVSQRTREIAVRIAVGGHRRQIVRRFITDGLRLSAFGIAIGLPLSLLGLRALMSDPDIPSVPLPSVTAIAALGVVCVAAAAVWIPARRAAAVDPAITLRSE